LKVCAGICKNIPQVEEVEITVRQLLQKKEIDFLNGGVFQLMLRWKNRYIDIPWVCVKNDDFPVQ
jgi:hypothetical protein